MDTIDTELNHLNLCDQLRSNSSFMKVMATLYYYGNQSMSAAQLVVAVRALDLLPLRGETPKSTIQGIISTSRKTARDLKKPDPFRIDKDGSGRQAKYCISNEVLNGVTVPEIQQLPDDPIILKPVEHATQYNTAANSIGKRHRKLLKLAKAKRRKNNGGESDDNGSDIDIDSEDDDFGYGASDDETKMILLPEEDTIFDYSLLFSPPPSDQNYIDAIDFSSYPIASHFAIVQQKGYSYPRFRSQEKIKIPKIRCEDKFRVADIYSNKEEQKLKDGKKLCIGRVFILADGHGGSGCAEFFVRHTSPAIQGLCDHYDVNKFDDEKIQQQFKNDIIQLVNILDQQYLDMKRMQLGRQLQNELNNQSKEHSNKNKNNDEDDDKNKENEKVDNDGCTLILNIFFGSWLINVNVGDSRTVLISAPAPGSTSPPTTHTTSHGSSASTSPYVMPPGGFDKDYIMEVTFASQDHKPYLEHLVRQIIENGGEFVDSVQNRVIKVELDKLRDDGNRQTKRYALKNARIRPKGYQAGQDYSNGGDPSSTSNFTTQSAIRTTVNNNNNNSNNNNSNNNNDDDDNNHNNNNNNNNNNKHHEQKQQQHSTDTRSQNGRGRSRHGYVPSLNVARSCGDLDFKMDPKKKIISCEPDVTFIRISDTLPTADNIDDSALSSLAPRTYVTSSGINKRLKRNFLFMSTDGTFDYMYEETPERQNRAISKILGPMIEDGEKIGKYLFEEAERSQTIEHNNNNNNNNDQNSKSNENNQLNNDKKNNRKNDDSEINNNNNNSSNNNIVKMDTIAKLETMDIDDTCKDAKMKLTNGETKPTTTNGLNKKNNHHHHHNSDNSKNENSNNGTDKVERKPLLYRKLDDKETKVRSTKEKTLVSAARFFANREVSNGFFSSKLQDYDDCTVILVEI